MREDEDEEYFEEQEWEMEGSGVTDRMVEKMIHQLYVSLGSMRAGNISSKLRRAFVSLLTRLKKREPSRNSKDAKFSMTLYDDAQLVNRLPAREVKRAEWEEQDARLSYGIQPAYRVGHEQELPRGYEQVDRQSCNETDHLPPSIRSELFPPAGV